ncbi:MAG: type VI secretion system tip protein VgrG [Acetobacteraceae bacterium]|nr:type VI secretion system tip protein VgrG [Acetobacteraceae bacterium]
MALSQDKRLLKVKTSLGPDAFLLRRLTVTEALEQSYVMQGELIATTPDAEVEADSLIGTTITCTIAWEERGVTRHFHGVISAFGVLDAGLRGNPLFRFEAVPAFWLLTRTMDCRIFQEKSVQQIIQAIVDERGVGPVTFKHMPGGTRAYCTQFNESDFDFIHRLLDESGCTYFFEHGDSTDGWTVIGEAAGFPTAEAGPLVVRGAAERPDAVTGWSSLSVVQPALQKSWDFNNLKPSQLLMAEAPTTLATTGLTSNLNVYRWPGGQAVRPDATAATPDLRMRRHEASYETWSGRSEEARLSPGQKVQIQEGVAGSPETWLLTAVTHSAFDETHAVGGGTAGYDNSFACISGDTAWRSPVHRPRPVIPGVQSAIVTGPSGEEIHTDEFGRVKLHFLWDHRDDAKNETSSCWVRCMQSFAGAWGGAWMLPRIGDEVLVAFQDGDPDRPVVVGSIYNEDGKPPWTLPANITRSGFRSRSSKQGSRDTANVIGFDDKKDSEQLYVQAQKDYLELVKNQKKVTVEGNEIREVTGASQNQSDGKRTTTIKGDESLTVQQGDETHEVTQGKRTTTINGNDTLEVKQGNREATIKMGNDSLTVSMGNMEVKVSMGNITIKADLGSITMEAMQGITLKGGPTSSIEIMPTGITFKSLKIDTQADLMNQTKGAIEQQSGSGMQKIGGAITMIGG